MVVDDVDYQSEVAEEIVQFDLQKESANPFEIVKTTADAIKTTTDDVSRGDGDFYHHEK